MSLGITVVVVTHELLSIERLNGRLIMLDQGKIVFAGTMAEAKATEHPVVKGFFQPGETTE